MPKISQSTLDSIMASNEIFISHPDGKMHDIPAITESCLCNPFCQKMARDERFVCSKCYARAGLGFKRYAEARYARNTQLLSGSLLDESMLPRLYSDVARFETHGDWVNLTSALNEIAIARFNPHTQFTVWTKRTDLLFELAKKGVRQPENLHVMISSPMMNQPLPEFVKRELSGYGWTVHFFTVMSLDALRSRYSDEELRQRGHEIITCGGRDCRSCMKCYGDHPHADVVELLKQDVPKAKKMGMRIA